MCKPAWNENTSLRINFSYIHIKNVSHMLRIFLFFYCVRFIRRQTKFFIKPLAVIVVIALTLWKLFEEVINTNCLRIERFAVKYTISYVKNVLEYFVIFSLFVRHENKNDWCRTVANDSILFQLASDPSKAKWCRHASFQMNHVKMNNCKFRFARQWSNLCVLVNVNAYKKTSTSHYIKIQKQRKNNTFFFCLLLLIFSCLSSRLAFL